MYLNKYSSFFLFSIIIVGIVSKIVIHAFKNANKICVEISEELKHSQELWILSMKRKTCCVRSWPIISSPCVWIWIQQLQMKSWNNSFPVFCMPCWIWNGCWSLLINIQKRVIYNCKRLWTLFSPFVWVQRGKLTFPSIFSLHLFPQTLILFIII